MNTTQREIKRELAAGSLALLAMLAACVSAPAPGGAQTCEVPLFIKQGSIDANVMILFDNSGSMMEAMFHPDYDPDQTWLPPAGVTGFNPTTVYYITTAGPYTPNTVPPTSSARPTTPSALLAGTHNSERARYYGNYLNWIFWHATDEQRSAVPVITRVQVAKLVVNDIINRSERVRFGLTVFNADVNNHGGTVIAECGADKATLTSTVNNIRANTWTPLGETMEDILDYFRRAGSGAPIQEHCQYNFLIVMTDGFPTMDRNVSAYLVDADGDGRDPGTCASIGAPYPESNYCSDHMDDVAFWMRHNDLRGDLPNMQTVITYTIGFGIDAGILQETASNGGGFYLTSNNAAELWLSLSRVMADIITRISSGAAVAVVSTERGDEDRLYRGKFMPSLWRGYLEAFDLPYEAGEPNVWEAGDLLSARNPADRTIFTGIGSQEYNWSTGHAADLMGRLGVSTVDSAATLMQWVRGHEQAGYRMRDFWPLGDIIHSTPVVVGRPSNFTVDEGYQTFLQTHRDRPRHIYVGGNDGMLHAFRADSGHEVWAFIPEFALPKLKLIAHPDYCHTYTVDQTPAIRDVKLSGTWKTVLVGGGREGGQSYFCLDITNPASPSLLWQTEIAGIGNTMSEAEYALVDGESIVLVGSGLDEAGGRASIYALDLATGSLLGQRLLSTVAGGRNKATTPKAVDHDFDGQTDVVYIGDMAGNLWRLEPDGGNPADWDAVRLFQCNQEITAQPSVAFDEYYNLLVYFGTGAYLTDPDVSTVDQNSFYCVIDNGSGTELARGDLRDQTSDPDDLGTADGWFVDLWNRPAGERVTERAVVVAGTVYFTSFAPSLSPCDAGGTSWLYHMSYRDGNRPDVDDDHQDGDAAERSEELGEGIASRPVVDIVNENIIVQSSDATINVQDIGQTIFHLTVRSWQENFDFVPGLGDSTMTP